MNVIEIEDIAELIGVTKQAAWTIVANKKFWNLPHCGYRKSGANRKRQWDAELAVQEIERIKALRVKAFWKADLLNCASTNRSWEMMNTSVRQFPANGDIRSYLIGEKGLAEYRAFA